MLRSDSHVLNATRGEKERIGQLSLPRGKEMVAVDELGPGDIGAVAKLRETRAGDVLADKPTELRFPPLDLPAPVMAFAYEAKSKGDEEKAATAIRRLEEEDPTLDVHRDSETGEQIIAGLTQVHVEVIVDRIKSRFGAEIELHPPRVAYLEGIRGKAPRPTAATRSRPAAVGSSPTAGSRSSPASPAPAWSSSTRSREGRSRVASSRPSRRGSPRRCAQGVLAGYPLKDLRVRLFDGQFHSVDSSEMAFKIAGSMAFKEAAAAAEPVPARADREDDDLRRPRTASAT